MKGNFNNDMLVVARFARGMSQEEAVERIRSLSQPTYSRIEAGLKRPTSDEVDGIAKGLGYRRDFFFHPFRRRPMPALFHRKRQRLTNRDWERIFARSEVRRICISLLLDSVHLKPKREFPPLMEPSVLSMDPPEIAASVRKLWMLPRGPISDVTSLIESAGVLIVPFDFGTDLIDGFSEKTHDNLPPIIFLNSRQPKDRFRFTLAHELGHIVMHRTAYPEMEDEANLFAAEFLMPSDDIRSDMYNTSLEHLLMLKGKWLVSVSSLVMCAKRIGRLNEKEYTDRHKEISRRGWRTNEPLPLSNDIERPRIVERLLNAHTEKLGYSPDDLSKIFGLMSSDPENIGKSLNIPSHTPKLRLVISN